MLILELSEERNWALFLKLYYQDKKGALINLNLYGSLTLIPTAPKVYWFPTGGVPYVPTFLWLINEKAA